MKFLKVKRLISTIAIFTMSCTLLSACGNTDNKEKSSQSVKSSTKASTSKSTASTEPKDKWEEARTTPYTPYPELVTYTVGLQVNPKVAYPEGSSDNAENNAYTRLYREKMNIQNKNFFEAVDGEDYESKVSMAITTGELPDIMSVDYKTLRELVENDLIADLTDAYNNCGSDLMKEIYASNGNKSLKMATFDGKLYAIPTTSIDAGPEMFWVRGDWMDKLKLPEPKTIEDIENILKEFIEKDPGGNGKGKTVGLALNPDTFFGGYSQAFQANNIFTFFGAYPKNWINGKDGSAVYGTVQPEIKEALKVLSDWFKKGLIDKEMAVRKYDDITALVTSGQCGAFFCGWWAPYMLEASYSLNNDVDWRAYVMPAGKDGKVTMFSGNPNQFYKVVRKGFEYPELAVKAVNVSLDYNQGTASYTDKSDICKEYLDYVNHAYGVDPIGGFDYFDAAVKAYEHISEAIDGKRKPEDMIMYENTLYKSCKKYLEDTKSGKKAESTDWLNYNARMVASKIMKDTEVNVVDPVFFDRTESMALKWPTLEKMEKETMLKILTGEETVDSFDTFVKEWMTAGGEQITKEVNEAIKK